MHELSLVMAVLELVESQARDHGVDQVLEVVVEVGDLACVEPAALDFCFQAAREGTVAAGAALTLRRVAGRARCAGCQVEFDLPALGEPCPGCGSYACEVVAGRELRVKELRVG